MKLAVFLAAIILGGGIFFFAHPYFKSHSEGPATCSPFYSKNLTRLKGTIKANEKFNIIYTYRLGFKDSPFDHILTDLTKNPRLRYVRRTSQGNFEEDTRFPLFKTEHARELTPFKFRGQNAVIMADHGLDTPPFPGGRLQLLIKEKDKWKDRSSLLPKQRGFYFNVTVLDENPNDTRILVNAIPESFVLRSGSQGDFHIDEKNTAIFKQPHSCFMTSEKLFFDGRVFIFLGGCDRYPNVEKTPRDRIAEYKNGVLTLLPENLLATREKDATWGTVDAVFADINNDGLPDLITTVHNFGFSQAGVQIHMNTSPGKNFESFASSYLPATNLKNKAFLPFIRSANFSHSSYPDIVAPVNEFFDKGQTQRIQSTFVLLENQNGKSFRDVRHCLSSELNSVMTAEFFDLDGNGKQDLFLISNSGQYEIFFNN